MKLFILVAFTKDGEEFVGAFSTEKKVRKALKKIAELKARTHWAFLYFSARVDKAGK